MPGDVGDIWPGGAIGANALDHLVIRRSTHQKGDFVRGFRDEGSEDAANGVCISRMNESSSAELERAERSLVAISLI